VNVVMQNVKIVWQSEFRLTKYVYYEVFYKIWICQRNYVDEVWLKWQSSDWVEIPYRIDDTTGKGVTLQL